MTDHNIHFIVNPHASGNKTGRDWEKNYAQIKKTLKHQSDFVIADGIGTGMTAALDASNSGDYTMLVSVGGEGAANETANGLYKSGKDLSLGFIRGGTVNDYLHIINWPLLLEDQVELLNRGMTRPTPLTKATGDSVRYSLNVGAVGVSANVSYMASIQRKLKWIKGQMRYTLLALRAITQWSNIPAVVKADDRIFEDKELSLFVGGFSTQTGGYKITYHSDPFGDKLAYTLGFDFSKLTMIKLMGTLEKGEHTEEIEGVFMGKASKVSVEAEKPLILEVDGEPFSFDSSTISMEAVPNALNILDPRVLNESG